MSTDVKAALIVDSLRVAFRTSKGFSFPNNGISFTHNHREWLGIMGASGSGKTVLAKSIAGFPTGNPGLISGKIMFQGQDLLDNLSNFVNVSTANGSVTSVKKDSRRWTKALRANYSRHAKHQFAYIFQSPMDALNPYCAISKHMKEAYRAAGVDPSEVERRSVDLFTALQLEDPRNVLKKYPHELSGGMAQRVVIALALAQRASYIIADECTTSLDPDSTLHAVRALQHAREISGCSILFITHETALAEAYSDRILKMEHGVLVS